MNTNYNIFRPKIPTLARQQGCLCLSTSGLSLLKIEFIVRYRHLTVIGAYGAGKGRRLSPLQPGKFCLCLCHFVERCAAYRRGKCHKRIKVGIFRSIITSNWNQTISYCAQPRHFLLPRPVHDYSSLRI